MEENSFIKLLTIFFMILTNLDRFYSTLLKQCILPTQKTIKSSAFPPPELFPSFLICIQILIKLKNLEQIRIKQIKFGSSLNFNQGWAMACVLLLSFQKNATFSRSFAFFIKRMLCSLRSFTFFIKERWVLCVLLRSL